MGLLGGQHGEDKDDAQHDSEDRDSRQPFVSVSRSSLGKLVICSFSPINSYIFRIQPLFGQAQMSRATNTLTENLFQLPRKPDHGRALQLI